MTEIKERSGKYGPILIAKSLRQLMPILI